MKMVLMRMIGVIDFQDGCRDRDDFRNLFNDSIGVDVSSMD